MMIWLKKKANVNLVTFCWILFILSHFSLFLAGNDQFLSKKETGPSAPEAELPLFPLQYI